MDAPVPTPLDRLPAWADDGVLHAVIEACQGSRNKLKYDPALGVLRLHKVLPLGTSFPFDFGFVPSTRAADGDPIDVLVLMDEAVPAGVLVTCRLVGVIEAEQTDRDGKTQRNDRLLAVANASHRYGRCKAIADIGDAVLEEIERFFVSYNEQQGNRFEPLGRYGLARARRLVEEAMQAVSSGHEDRHR
jgi:inorganic pyrophosphatase